MSKFKVGDKVRVRKDLSLTKQFTPYSVTEEMMKVSGDIFEVKKYLVIVID